MAHLAGQGSAERRHPQTKQSRSLLYVPTPPNLNIITSTKPPTISHHTSTTFACTINMPLVVPGLQTSLTGSNSQDWQSKLLGKKLGDSSDQTVSIHIQPTTHQEISNVLTRGLQRRRSRRRNSPITTASSKKAASPPWTTSPTGRMRDRGFFCRVQCATDRSIGSTCILERTAR